MEVVNLHMVSRPFSMVNAVISRVSGIDKEDNGEVIIHLRPSDCPASLNTLIY